MQELHSKIEALLFIESRPLKVKRVAKLCEVAVEDIDTALNELQQQYAEREGGITLVREGETVQLTSSDRHAEFIAEYLDAMGQAELTRPSLETLTIIAYRGPVSKDEVELIRGVNCSLIMRNLMIRGLVEEVGETETGSPIYTVTIEFLKELGVKRVTDLPNYEELNKNVHLQDMLGSAAEQNGDFFAAESLRSFGSPEVKTADAGEAQNTETNTEQESLEDIVDEITAGDESDNAAE